MSSLLPIGWDLITGQKKIFDPLTDTLDVPGIGTWDNVVFVNSVSDLPTPSGGTHTLDANTTYWFNDATYNLAGNSLTFSTGSQVFGVGRTVTTITYTGVGSLINGTNMNIHLRDIALQASSGSIFNITNTTSYNVYLEDVEFSNATSLGTIAGGGMFMRWCRTSSCTNGLTISGTLSNIIFDFSSIRAMSGGANSFGLKILTGATASTFRIHNSIFEVAATHYGIWFESAVSPTVSGIIQGCIFYGAGTNRLSGINGGTSGWDIAFGSNTGIAGLQYVDVEVISTADATYANGAGTYTEPSTVRAYVPTLAEYDPMATVMQAKVMALITSAEATFQMGVRNLTTATNVGGLKTAVLPGSLGYVDSDYVAITPNRMYQAYYVKTSNAGGNVATRFGLKMKLKIY